MLGRTYKNFGIFRRKIRKLCSSNSRELTKKDWKLGIYMVLFEPYLGPYKWIKIYFLIFKDSLRCQEKFKIILDWLVIGFNSYDFSKVGNSLRILEKWKWKELLFAFIGFEINW